MQNKMSEEQTVTHNRNPVQMQGASLPSAPFNLTMGHPRLTETDASSIRTFLRKQGQHVTSFVDVLHVYEVQSCARQINGENEEEYVLPVPLVFFANFDFVESSVNRGFVENATSYDKVTEEQVRAFLDIHAEQSKEVITLSELDKIAANKLLTNMRRKMVLPE